MAPKSKKNERDIILVTVRGLDAPGITAKLTRIIGDCGGVRIIDIEQTVVHQKLMLSLLLKFDQGRNEKTSVLKELLFAARELGVYLEIEAFNAKYLSDDEKTHDYAITCLGSNVGAKPLACISEALAAKKVNINRINRITQHELACVELLVSAPRKLNHKTLSRDLLALAVDLDVDIAMQPADLSRRAKRLVVMDMDSTLVASEAIDELAKAAGKSKQVQAVTKKAMEGKMDFSESLKMRVAHLKGLPVESVEHAVNEMKLNQGAERLIKVLKHLGYKIGVVSGGFTPFTNHLQEKLELDFAFANELEVKKGKLTGKVAGTIIDAKGKAMILETIAKGMNISLDQTVAIGDGANDLQMLGKAGMGVAFHAKEVVRRNAHASIGKHSGLDSLLYLLGISERELKGI